MRYVPTTIFIDTCIIVENGCNFNSQEITRFKNQFVREGLRLLVPEIMEREVLRRFRQVADKSISKLVETHDDYHVKKMDLVNLPSREELESRYFESLKDEWSKFKDHFLVEDLPIVDNLETVVDWYFEITPPFAQGKKSKEFPDAFMVNVLDQYHKQHRVDIAVISCDDDFKEVCEKRTYFHPFKNLDSFIQAFQPKLSGKEELPGDIDFTIPITTEDLTVLKGILSHDNRPTTIEVERVRKLLDGRGTSYDYFFQYVKDVFWLDHLDEWGYFDMPPDAKEATLGYFGIPRWPPIEYLNRVFDAAPEKVMKILTNLPNTNNFPVLEGIFSIVLKANSAKATSDLARFISSFLENYRWGHDRVISFLKKPYLFDLQLSEITPTLILKVVEFQKDSRQQEKEVQRNSNFQLGDSILKPTPRFNEWEYKEILDKGVRSLAKNEPFQVAHLLVDAVASMIRLGMHQQDFEKGVGQDYSEVWCQKVNMPDPDYQDIRGSLVQTLTYACQQVYRSTQDSVNSLDQALRNYRWNVFRRLRQFLYASYPSNQTLPWIREQIFEYEKYSSETYGYEFQLMIRNASEHFGHLLLSVEERSQIFKEILSGPAREEFRAREGEGSNDENYQRRQRYFHCVQLHPFATLLSGDNQDYFEELKQEFIQENIADDSNLLIQNDADGWVEYRSPKSIEELETLTDVELVTYLNEWDEEHRDKDNRLVEINIKALAEVFQSLFKERIVSNQDRLAFWMNNRVIIKRPVYWISMLKSMTELVVDGEFKNLDEWIKFCEWVLSQPDPMREQNNLKDITHDHHDWSQLRWTVVEFVDACISRPDDVLGVERINVLKILRLVCTQHDWRLDNAHHVILNRDDPYVEAINCARGRALNSLISLSLWIKRNMPEKSLSDLTEILSQRTDDDAVFLLTRPEHALLGVKFGNLCYLAHDWASDNHGTIFPQSNDSFWRAAFGNYLQYNHPAISVFEILRVEFDYGIDNLEKLSASFTDHLSLVNRLGQHIFSYYLWDVYPLKGETSLIERFYFKTNKNRLIWADLFSHIGRILQSSDKHVDEKLTQRVVEFFEWRCEVAEPVELREFTFWLNAECLTAIWRLQSFLEVLEVSQPKSSDVHMLVKFLANVLPGQVALVSECFAKLTDLFVQDNQAYFPIDETKVVLKAGLINEDRKIKKYAERARDNLLNRRDFGFLDIDDNSDS